MQPEGMRLFFRIAASGGFLATIVAAFYGYVIGGLAEGSYEEEVRSEPWEWVVLASVAGLIAAVIAMRGLMVCSRIAVRIGALGQAVSAFVILAVALMTFEVDRTEMEQRLIAITAVVLLFDVGVFLGSWALPPRRVREGLV